MSQPDSAHPLLHRPHASCGVGVLVDLEGRASHTLVAQGLELLANLDHRGARGAEEKTGDGAGMLLQKPHALFAALIPDLPPADRYGVAQCFLPRDPGQRAALRNLIEATAEAEGMRLLAWRDVPTDDRDLGDGARATEPAVVQAFFAPLAAMTPAALDTQLYVLRRVLEKAVAAHAAALDPSHRFYLCSLHRRKLVYKGLLTPDQLRTYYPDLSDPRLASALVLVHSRFSTNTLGAWDLAHPYRAVVHNGEINTLRGNLNWMQARESDLACARLGAAIDKIRPVTREGLSDTAVFDQVLELLVEAGRPLAKALRMMVPEAWEQDAGMAPARRDFYEYCSTLMEPWDGPALVAASDGVQVAAILDRNGLRPCRYWITRDHRLIMASESGVLDVPPGEIVEKGRLRPGQLLLADTATRRIVPEAEIFDSLTDHPYGEWLAVNRVRLADRAETAEPSAALDPQALRSLQRAFGVTSEQLDVMLRPMAESGKDPIGSMGSDTPPAALSARGPSLFAYFNQLFAQVSNPPIDFLRETLVTSLSCYVGRRGNLLEETAAHCRQLRLDSPVLTTPQWDAIRGLDVPGLRAVSIPITCPAGDTLADAVEELCARVDAAVEQGFALLLLSDRAIGPARIAIPSLLAVAGVHHHLIRRGRRTRVALVLDSGEPSLVHHLCTLVGYGADAVHPWLAYAGVAQLCGEGVLEMPPGRRSPATATPWNWACSRSCPRWASPPWRATRAHRCSRRSGWTGNWWSVISPAPACTSPAWGWSGWSANSASAIAWPSARAPRPAWSWRPAASMPGAATANGINGTPTPSAACSRRRATPTGRPMAISPPPSTIPPRTRRACAACSISPPNPARQCPWTRWSRSRRSCAASRPAPCPSAR